MRKAVTLYQTTVGKKVVMALSGLVIFGFVVGHMVGNLQVFLGREAINGYAETLRQMPVLLWGTRLLLLIAIPAHVIAAVQLAGRRWAARPVGYQRFRPVQASYAVRTMYLSGPVLGLFIVVHLLHLTLGVNLVPGVTFDPDDVYGNVVRGFAVPWVTAFYVVAMAALAFHLGHGAWSFLQSLGINHPRYTPGLRSVARVIGWVVAVGFAAVPLGVALKIIAAG